MAIGQGSHAFVTCRLSGLSGAARVVRMAIAQGSQAGTAGRGWRKLGAPPSELRLAFTLPTGQSFRWRRCGPEDFIGVVGQRLVGGSDAIGPYLACKIGFLFGGFEDARLAFCHANLPRLCVHHSAHKAYKDEASSNTHPTVHPCTCVPTRASGLPAAAA
jgi:8-oxoguanine DNA glycosylase, N-terminal domain